MNKVKRKRLDSAVEKIIEARNIIDSVANDEDNSLDNLPDGLKDSEMGNKMEEAVDLLMDIVVLLDEAIDSINSIIE